MALVIPILLLLLFGIIEFGMAFNKRLSVGNATQSSVRVGSAVANNKYADILALEALEQGLIALPNNGQDVVKSVQIYKANSAGDPTSGCPSSTCNVYAYSYNVSACNWSPCPDPDPPVNYDTSNLNWDPVTRDATVGTLDVLGLRVYFAHTWITGFVPFADVTCQTPPANCWSDTSVMRLEPQQLGVSP